MDDALETISTVIPPSRWFKKGYCQLQAKVCTQSTGYYYVYKSSLPRKKDEYVSWPYHVAVDWDVKHQTKQTKSWSFNTFLS